MIRILPYAAEHQSGIVNLILPIQQLEFGLPITLDAQPDLLDIPAFYQKGNMKKRLFGNTEDRTACRLPGHVGGYQVLYKYMGGRGVS